MDKMSLELNEIQSLGFLGRFSLVPKIVISFPKKSPKTCLGCYRLNIEIKKLQIVFDLRKLIFNPDFINRDSFELTLYLSFFLS